MAKIAKIGRIAFIIGVILALLIGLFGWGASTAAISILIVIGLIVGLLNISEKEMTGFLFAVLVLVVIAKFGGDILSLVAGVGVYLQGILNALITFIVPTAIIVALKAVYALAEKK
ncbi:hypothetical protein HZB88_04430 [archaeon]|nr:hypothetical protein [archaeon]